MLKDRQLVPVALNWRHNDVQMMLESQEIQFYRIFPKKADFSNLKQETLMISDFDGLVC